ncbi:MAG: hypothetical protein J6I62_08220 [Selenomonadaceae bacterium]|nr:hypothetical protein [Selenomonadaceae bacterium]
MGLLQNIGRSYLNSRINNLLDEGEAGGEISYTLTANGQEVVLPVDMESYECKVGNNNETINIINAGEYLMKGKTGLKTISLSSFFPAQEYDFARYGGNPWGVADTIEEWRKNNETVELSISGTSVEFKCLIESFSVGEKDGSGDVYYTIELREYREIGVDPKKKDKVSELNERPKLTFLERAGLNLAKNVINGQPPTTAIANALGNSGLTNKQKGYLEIAKAVTKKGGIADGDSIGFNKKGEFQINGKVIK